MTEKPIEVFFSYSHQDEAFKDELVKHLSILQRQGVISGWHDRLIKPGSEWDREIDTHLNSADIILLMVSADFLASDYCWGVEVQKAMQRHEAGEACVIPVVLRWADWAGAPFAKFQALPKNAKPIASWSDRDEAFYDVARGICIAIETLLKVQESRRQAEERHWLEEERHRLEEEFHQGIAERAIRKAERQKPQLKKEIGAITNVMQKIWLVIKRRLEALNTTNTTYPQLPNIMPDNTSVPTVYRLGEVFKSSGVPTVTFVEPERFTQLKLAVQQPGIGVVLEGSSGVGKTTALRKALEQTHFSLEPKLLSARTPKHIEQIKSIRRWHRGLVVIDDLHRLDANTSLLISDYLKYLADNELVDRKLVVIGIPETSNRLISFSFDLALRVKIFRFKREKDEIIESMIRKGEDALNIIFSQKLEIIAKANGSLNVAQLLCYYIAALAGVEQTQTTTQVITSGLDEAVSCVMEEIEPKFSESVRRFVLLGGHSDTTSVTILEELAASNDGVLPLHHLGDSRPNLQKEIDHFLAQNYLPNLYEEFPQLRKFICFHQETTTLVVDDPQLIFYLRQFSTSGLLSMANKSKSEVRNKIFISYSHSDAAKLDFFERLLTHLKPLERERIIDIWSDKKIRAGSHWRQEIEKALGSAKIAILLVSGNFIASDFITNNELPPLLAAANNEGAVIIPVILSPCRVPKSISEIQSANSPSKPLTSMNYNEQEEIFAMLVEIVEEYLGL